MFLFFFWGGGVQAMVAHQKALEKSLGIKDQMLRLSHKAVFMQTHALCHEC